MYSLRFSGDPEAPAEGEIFGDICTIGEWSTFCDWLKSLHHSPDLLLQLVLTGGVTDTLALREQLRVAVTDPNMPDSARRVALELDACIMEGHPDETMEVIDL